MADQPSHPSDRRPTPDPTRLATATPWLLAAALVTAVFLAYQPAWRAGYIFSDDIHLLNNPVLRPGGLAKTWVPGYYLNYWPLTFSAYWVQFKLWGLDNPIGFHLMNIALHALNALLVWRVLVLLRVPGAVLTAAIFALHPVNVQSVAWVTQLKTVLPMLLALLSVISYLQHEQRGGWWRYALAVLLFALSALGRGAALTLPVVLLMIAWWQRGKITWRDVLRVVPYVVIAAAMAGVEVWTQRSAIGTTNAHPEGLFARAAGAGWAVWFYIYKLVLPLGINFIYPRWTVDPRSPLSYVPDLLLLLLLAWAWVKRRGWGRPVLMVLVCYVGLLAPVLGFVTVSFMRFSLVADHYQYLAMVAPLAAAVAGATMLVGQARPGIPEVRPTGRREALAWDRARRSWQIKTWSAAAGVLIILGGLTFLQAGVYQSEWTLWHDVLAKDPRCWLAENNLGRLLDLDGKHEEAMEYFSRAVKHNPDFPEAHNNLGRALAGDGRTKEAIEHYETALYLKPDYAEAHDNLGKILEQSDPHKAIEHYETALRVKPLYVDPYINLAWLLATLEPTKGGNTARALVLAQRACELTGRKNPIALDALGVAYAAAGRFQDALNAAQQAADLAHAAEQWDLERQISARQSLYRSGKRVDEPESPKPPVGLPSDDRQ